MSVVVRTIGDWIQGLLRNADEFLSGLVENLGGWFADFGVQPFVDDPFGFIVGHPGQLVVLLLGALGIVKVLRTIVAHAQERDVVASDTGSGSED